MSWDLLGHEWAEHMLREHIARGSTRHAYLFTGPSGIGKRSLALRFAQALNCPTPTAPGEPCRTCRTCRQIERMQHVDLSPVCAEEEGGRIKVDAIRELQRLLALAPYEARYRVALLLRFQEANANAQNALLKTLEEPPTRVILLVTADAPENLLPTITSRCEVMRLRPMPLENAGRALAGLCSLEADEARLLAHIASGRIGFAMKLNENPDLLEQRRQHLQDLQELLAMSRRERFSYVEQLNRQDSRSSFRRVMLDWLSYWRDLHLSANGSSVPISNLDHVDEIRALSRRVDAVTACTCLARLEKALTVLDTTGVNVRLLMENILLDWPHLSL